MVMVGIGFGLICVLQSVLNISLRLHSGECKSSQVDQINHISGSEPFLCLCSHRKK